MRHGHSTVCACPLFSSLLTHSVLASYSINLEFERDELLCLPSWSVCHVSTLAYCSFLFGAAIPEWLFLECSLHRLRRFYADIYSSVCTISSQNILLHFGDNMFLILLLFRTVWMLLQVFSDVKAVLFLSGSSFVRGTRLRHGSTAVRSPVRSLMG